MHRARSTLLSLTASCLLAATALGAPAGSPASPRELYEAKKWAEVVARADALPPDPENAFWAARALRNLDRHEEARTRYLSVVQGSPGHARAADAALEAALMLIAPLEQVAHSPEDRAIAVRAAREIEEVAAARAADAATLARASYLAGNTWRIAEEDEAARKAYLRARSAGDADYAAKALEKQAELAFRRLDLDEAGALMRECASRHARTASGRRASRALSRLAVVGKPAPDFETELWAKGPPVGRDDLLGKVTLVFAFAVWCPHCKRELPHAADLLDRYGGRGFQVVGLTDNTRTQKTADVFPFVEDARYRMSYPVAVDLEGRTTTALSLSGLPSAALIDRSAIVRWVGHPNYVTDETIERLLGEATP